MSRTLRASSIALCLIAAAAAAFAQDGERVLEYVIEVNVNAGGALDVAEQITVRAEGNQIRRGIFRDFLDVEEAWTRKFTAAVGAAAAAAVTAHMAWYHGAHTGDLGGLVKAVSSGLSSSIASASTPPGSSSGGGGGGSSGGGGGGGGGGGR